MKRIISVLLALTLILSLCIISASAGDTIINLSNNDGTADILIVYGYSMTAVQQKQYNAADWDEKMSILKERYAASKADLLEYLDSVCEYEVLRDTSINRIYLRVPAIAIDEIKQINLVKSLSYYTLPASKLNDEAQKLIAGENPEKIVKVNIWTDRADVVAMRDYLNLNKQEMNRYLDIETENGVTEFAMIERAYYSAHNRAVLDEITAKTDAVYQPVCGMATTDGDTWMEIDLLWSFAVDIPVGQIETLGTIDGISAVTYEPKDETNKVGGELIDVIAADPEKDITVAVERVVTHPVTIEDMPAYVSGDKESYVTARHQLAEYNKCLNEEFIKELSEYAEFEAKMNTITTIVLLKLKAKDVYALAKCGSVFEINYISEQKWSVQAGEYKLLGDTDGDASVTILDATGIQRELAELGVAAFDEECADYDEDGDMTILDATAIQRTLVDL